MCGASWSLMMFYILWKSKTTDLFCPGRHTLLNQFKIWRRRFKNADPPLVQWRVINRMKKTRALGLLFTADVLVVLKLAVSDLNSAHWPQSLEEVYKYFVSLSLTFNNDLNPFIAKSILHSYCLSEDRSSVDETHCRIQRLCELFNDTIWENIRQTNYMKSQTYSCV